MEPRKRYRIMRALCHTMNHSPMQCSCEIAIIILHETRVDMELHYGHEHVHKNKMYTSVILFVFHRIFPEHVNMQYVHYLLYNLYRIGA